MLDSHDLRSSKARTCGRPRSILSAVVALGMLLLPAVGQQASPKTSDGAKIRGVVVGADGKIVRDAIVSLDREEALGIVETNTDSAGEFTFSALSTGKYRVSAEKAGLRSRATAVVASSDNGMEEIHLVLGGAEQALNISASSSPGAQRMEFADEPNFTVAGVTDWTAVGGHGSDSTLRTSESLTNEALMLKPESSGLGTARAEGGAGEGKESESTLRAALANTPNGFNANHRLGRFYLVARRYPEAIPLLEKAYGIDPADKGNQYDLALAYEGSGDIPRTRERIRVLLLTQQNADLHRLMGELDEKLGDPLSAVHEYEEAVKLSPSEQNYFEWGSELLLHRAVWQAQEIFRKGAEAYPKSARMQTALGTAFFAGARYNEAALRLCAASDLTPADPNPYIFMGKIQMAAPNSLVCVEPKLARFVQQQPRSSTANYMYAMSILKRQEQSPDRDAVQHAEALLTKAVTIDRKCSEAYLQLGIIAASRHDFDRAIGFYIEAIEADPDFADAHYRLGVAYDRTGKPERAKHEFQLHDEIKQQQAEAIERQRREVKQFLVVPPGTGPSVH